MNTDEQSLIDGLFTRLQQAEKEGSARDAQADERIKGHVSAQPAAPYYMAQAILVQEAAIKRLSEQNQQLQTELQQARSQAAAPAQQGGGGFLSSIFGGGNRDVQQPARAVQPQGNGWREPARQAPAYQPPPQQNYVAPGAQAPAGGGFMRGALQTAAGVAGGVMLAQGISSLFHHDNPQEIVEVIKEEPAQASDSGGWNDSGDAQQVSNDSWNDQGGLADAGYDSSGDSGFFSDDDDFV
ncbi:MULTISPECIES: DUF2076 domain-containing protein [Pseudomonas]|uniref:DUF2076 domain-containing protein n=1 Tax=Pseudomonas TaxID=286 RepID=UPI00257B8321|nr:MULTISPECIES: DUF2076 domain-containing protein [Pseudomonas]